MRLCSLRPEQGRGLETWSGPGESCEDIDYLANDHLISFIAAGIVDS